MLNVLSSSPPSLSTRHVLKAVIGSLSNNVFERRTSTGSGLFSFFDCGFAQIFSQIASITVKKLRNTNFISARHVKRENTSLPVDVRRTKTSLLKLPIKTEGTQIHFLSDVLVAVASLDLIVHILAGKRDSRRHSSRSLSADVVLVLCDR